MADDNLIELYKVDRVCKPDIDVSQLSLTTNVDRSESVYTQKLVKLSNASLPGGVIVHGVQAELFDWDLFLILKYRQTWTPNGYGLGELLYSISLMPDEELTLEMKTWETSKSQQDREETLDQKNVSDIKDTSSASSEVSEAGEKTTNTNVNGKASYSGFGFSASIEAGWSENVKETQAQNAKETRDRSQQATNEYRASHKVKLTVSREEGSESKTTRKIRNINRAHTLNVNYYEILKSFDVSLSLTKVPLAMLGPEADLAADVLLDDDPILSRPGVMALVKEDGGPGVSGPKFVFPGLVLDLNLRATADFDPVDPIGPTGPVNPPPATLTLGRLIRYSQSQNWVSAFIDQNGFSPIKLLYELWSEQLFLGAVPAANLFGGGAGGPPTISDADRTAFRDTMLRFVRPIEGWVAGDEKGNIRWGYEVIEGRETACLEFLYPLLPTSASEMHARIAGAGLDGATAGGFVADRFVAASERSLRARPVALARRVDTSARTSGIALPRTPANRIASDGPFKGKSLAQFRAALPDWIADLKARLAEVRTVENPVERWNSTLPTQGIYSDLTLGVCSGAEDYLEIQRQFDLETRKLEIEKLKCEIEKLKLDNQRLEAGEPGFTIGADVDTLAINLTMPGREAPASVQVKPPMTPTTPVPPPEI